MIKPWNIEIVWQKPEKYIDKIYAKTEEEALEIAKAKFLDERTSDCSLVKASIAKTSQVKID